MANNVETSCHPFNRVVPVISLITILLKTGCPAAIAWLVVSVVVFPFDHLAFGFLSHVRQKVLKPEPAITYGNASASIILPGSIISIGASVNQMFPAYEGLGDLAFSSVAVYGGSNPSRFYSKTPARPAVPTAKMAIQYGAVVSAGTETKAGSDPLAIGANLKWSIVHHFKPSKSGSDEV
jgi:hypothetical protein